MNKTNDFKYNLPAYSDPVDIEDLNDNFRGIDDALMAGLCKKDYTGNNMGSSDPSARKYAWAPWLEIVNDNEFDVVVTDRNAPVGSEEATINIAAGQTFRKYINGRYYMNFYVQDQHDVTFKWFTNAETYINESGGGGGGGGTGTVTSVSVQGGSGSHLTGSGNPIETSGTITINVDEGYSIPSDNDQDAWDVKAADLKAEIDSSTYVLTLQLKDSSGNLIGNERTIDLPLETMVVDGEYDPLTKKIKLELKNGNYVEFSVADLVSGLQTELSANNKLDPDYIDYDSSHRAVSDTEKDTWNGKQNALTFDDTPTQNSNNPVKSGGIYSALAGKQASLDNTQLAAVNSGIDSSKVGQISTNQTNILSVQNKVGTNYVYDYEHGMVTPTTYSGVTFTWLDNGKLSIKSNGTNTSDVYYNLELDIGSKYVGKTMSFVGGVASKCNFYISRSSGAAAISTNGADVTIPSDAVNKLFIAISANAGALDIVVEPMIRDSHNTSNTYSAPALPNYDLTRLESEDRASLAEVVDSGAKNIIAPNSVTYPFRGMTLTYSSDGVLVTGTATENPYSYIHVGTITITAGMTYVLYDPTGSSPNTAYFYVDSSTAFNVVSPSISDTPQYLVAKNSGTYNIYLRSPYNVAVNKLYKPMVCTKAAFCVSNKFVPFGNDPFYQVPINHNMIYRGRNLGATLTDAQHTALSSGNFNDLYLGDYWTKTVTIPAGTYTGGDGEEVTVPAQTNITLKAVIADFDTFYAGYASSYAAINTHHAAVIVTGFSNVVWNGSNNTTGGYVNSLIHKWLVGSALPQIETWFGSAKVLSHQKLLTNAITGDAASGWAWSSQKISLLSENQMYGSKVWGNSKAANGGYEPGEAFKHLNVFNHIDANLLFGNKNIWLRDIASAVWAAFLNYGGYASSYDASATGVAPAALILLS